MAAPAAVATAASAAAAPSIADVAQHAAASTLPLAEAAHTTLSNALSLPVPEARHDKTPAAVSVVISDPASFARKKAAMVAAGHSKLQVIADFDRTISAFMTKAGKMCAASHQLLESCVGFDRSTFLPKMDAINTKYFALEIDASLTVEQRAAHMTDWWTQAHDLLVAQGIKHSAIEDAVARSRADGSLELRKGAREFLTSLNERDVPCLVFSAGVRETILQTMTAESLMLPNLHLIGNLMNFSAEGLLLSFGEETITSSNKNYSHVSSMEPEYHARSLDRRNVILAGDNIGDAGMATGLDGIQNCIKIGLLHDNIDARLEQFKAAFDVVLLNDADFSFMQQLVDDICAPAN